ncbi:sulfotransferase domain-containing protein [Pseudoalteromonas sp. XMcav1-K]|uniref:sulfotransferase domain-containing protein n=1 Tax=Pseudoalteromonas sp. XMcav1-K TaxID=3374372 RepID=UPI00375809FF
MDELISKIAENFSSDFEVSKLRNREKQFIWHVAMPKSGSTWVSNTLSEILNGLGWETMSLLPCYGYRQQELDTKSILQNNRLNKDLFAIQQHCCASEYVLETIALYDIKVVLQVRDLLDCLVSSLDHLDKESVIQPNSFMTIEQWQVLDKDQRTNYIVDFIAPWYFKFITSWTTLLKQYNIKYHIVKYEQLLLQPEQVFVDLFEFCGVSMDNLGASVEEIITPDRPSRLNVGITGRGQTLSNNVKQKVDQLRSYYSEIDLSLVGL